jgi:uncharacterized membrane protein
MTVKTKLIIFWLIMCTAIVTRLIDDPQHQVGYIVILYAFGFLSQTWILRNNALTNEQHNILAYFIRIWGITLFFVFIFGVNFMLNLLHESVNIFEAWAFFVSIMMFIMSVIALFKTIFTK